VTEDIIRHEPVDIAVRAAEAAVAGRPLSTRIIFFCGHAGEPDGSVMYEFGPDGSARVMSDDCEAVIEDGVITGYRHLEEETA
jgi:hypothetical protein